MLQKKNKVILSIFHDSWFLQIHFHDSWNDAFVFFPLFIPAFSLSGVTWLIGRVQRIYGEPNSQNLTSLIIRVGGLATIFTILFALHGMSYKTGQRLTIQRHHGSHHCSLVNETSSTSSKKGRSYNVAPRKKKKGKRRKKKSRGTQSGWTTSDSEARALTENGASGTTFHGATIKQPETLKHGKHKSPFRHKLPPIQGQKSQWL
jgi:hypothetical protein